MKLHKSIGVFHTFAAVAKAHFGLIFPKSLQTTPEDEGDLHAVPCATFDPNTPGAQFSNYPWQGSAIHVATTHPKVTWVFNVVLLSQYPNFVSMAPNIGQTAGTGVLCFGQGGQILSLPGGNLLSWVFGGDFSVLVTIGAI